MKKALFVSLLLVSVTCVVARADMGAWFSGGFAGVNYMVSIGNFYSAPHKDVIEVRNQNIPDEELPVVFYLAQQANVSTSEIIELRQKGTSWRAITSIYGLGAEIYYVPIKENMEVGPPYGHAYGYYKNKPKNEWKKIKLTDDDIVNLVNLKFISGHYNYPPETIMKMKEMNKNKNFSDISYDIRKQAASEKMHKNEAEKNAKSGNKSNNKSDNKGQGNSGKKPDGNSGNNGNSNGHGKSGNHGNNKNK